MIESLVALFEWLQAKIEQNHKDVFYKSVLFGTSVVWNKEDVRYQLILQSDRLFISRISYIPSHSSIPEIAEIAVSTQRVEKNTILLEKNMSPGELRGFNIFKELVEGRLMSDRRLVDRIVNEVVT